MEMFGKRGHGEKEGGEREKGDPGLRMKRID